jgi:hypothetical protein
MVKKHTKRRNQMKHRRKTNKHRSKNMKGGVLPDNSFSSQGSLHLSDLGSNNNSIISADSTSSNNLNNMNISGISNISGLNESGNTTLADQSFDFGDDIEPIAHADDDVHNLDLDDSFVSNGSLNQSDLNLSNNSSDSGNTTVADDSLLDFGGKRSNRSAKKSSKKRRKTRKNKRKQRGGMCFGSGVGANSYDPNFSIYNTRELELFPYRPK